MAVNSAPRTLPPKDLSVVSSSRPWPPLGAGSVWGAAAVGASEQFQHVTVGVVEVHAVTAVSGVYLAGLLVIRIGPILQLLRPDPVEDRLELSFADQERIMLRADVPRRGHSPAKLCVP